MLFLCFLFVSLLWTTQWRTNGAKKINLKLNYSREIHIKTNIIQQLGSITVCSAQEERTERSAPLLNKTLLVFLSHPVTLKCDGWWLTLWQTLDSQLSACLPLDGQVSELLDPEGAINTVCDFTSYMPCPGHSCPSLDNFAAQREDWLALWTLYTSWPSVWGCLSFTPWKTEPGNSVHVELKWHWIKKTDWGFIWLERAKIPQLNQHDLSPKKQKWPDAWYVRFKKACPWCWGLKYLNNYHMDCHWIWYIWPICMVPRG